MNEKEELAAPLSKTPEPLQPRGQARDTGLGAGLGRALNNHSCGSCFLLQWEQKRGCSSRGRVTCGCRGLVGQFSMATFWLKR